jgi:hypothetical protein
MNIYSDGKWGSYRHLSLDSCATVSVPHAWVNLMIPGDLSSFQWLEGNLDPDRFVLVFCVEVLDTHKTFIRLVNVANFIKLFYVELKVLYYEAATDTYITVFTRAYLFWAS